ncbi:transmembrane protein [Halalkalibacter wakoensis JCM 9140]|uniref:Transmembrane protein n=1 Tax=Halalkalibacter wakoensis JCM 9140 TaxID=1236970 RepID=W4Q022_9BACI|nr:transmembrane protein [Halalkalibacter wakoensis JCM 9140]
MFVLIAFLFGRNWPLFEALAAVTLIKYGIWAVAMNLAGGWAGDTLTFNNYMLIFSHAGMAIQAVLYAPYYRIKPWHLIVASVWTLHNDIIDYVFMMHPWVSARLMPEIELIGYFTFWLSIFSITVVYLLSVRKNRLTLEIQ